MNGCGTFSGAFGAGEQPVFLAERDGANSVFDGVVVNRQVSLEDLKSIGDYIAQENANAAYNVLIRIKATTDNLSRHPEIVVA
mgnify:CR=1 FL=1